MNDEVVCLSNTWLGSMVSSGGINNLRLPPPFPPCLFPSVSAPKHPGIWQAASASEDESMSGAMSKQVINPRNCKKKKKKSLLDIRVRGGSGGEGCTFTLP